MSATGAVHAVKSQGLPAPSRTGDAIRIAVSRFAGAITRGDVLGAVLLVTQGERVLVDKTLGYRDVAKTKAMTKDTLFQMASNTKALTAAAVITLIDDGKLKLDSKISQWFPTFDGPYGSQVTVHQLLTHTSGLRIPTLFLYPLTPRTEEDPRAPTLIQECMRFGEVGPAAKPGESFSYSNAGYNLLAGLVEVVSGEKFGEYVRDRIYEPLGIADSFNHESEADPTRMSQVVRSLGEDRWHMQWHPFEEPAIPFARGSGGMISTASDYERFARLFLSGGEREGRSVLSADLVAEATKDQVEHLEDRYGFGWRITSFGWSHTGSHGSYVWCNPDLDLVGVVLTQTRTSPRLTRARQRFRQEITRALSVDPKPPR
jgi:CubicO group peptidase (beta-lactamase class C family)